MENNKGLSLIELVVVITIISIMAGLVTIGMNFLPGKRVSACTKELKSFLQQGRMDAMSRENQALIIARDRDGSYVITKQGNKKSRKIGGASLTISYEDSTGVWYDINGEEKLILSYDRASGALRPVISQIKNNGDVIYQVDSAGNYVYCTKIAIKESNEEERLVLVRATGKIYAE